ncbi:MAG: hypothetical protein RR356_05160 [Bacteroidales bacterium]
MADALYGYLKDNKLDVLLEPLPVEAKSTVDFENPDRFVFVYEYALQPEFEIDFAKLPAVKSFKIEATENEKEDLILQMRKRHGEYSTPDTIEEDDYISVKYADKEGFFFTKDLNEEGKKLLIGKKLNDELKIAFRTIFTDEMAFLRFMKMTEKEIETDHNYEFDAQIINIGRVMPAELNEDFFKKAYPDESVKNVGEMEKAVAEQIENQWKTETDRQFMNDAIGILLDHVEITFPDEFIKRYILTTQKEMTEEQLNEKYEDYQKSFKWQMVEAKLVKDHQISVSEEEVKAYVRDFFMKNYFANFNEADIADRLNTLVNDALKNKKDVKNIYDQLFDNKIQDILRSQFKVEEKTGDFNDFVAEVTGKKIEKPAKKKAEKTKNTEKETEEEKVEKIKSDKPKATPKPKKTTTKE